VFWLCPQIPEETQPAGGLFIIAVRLTKPSPILGTMQHVFLRKWNGHDGAQRTPERDCPTKAQRSICLDRFAQIANQNQRRMAKIFDWFLKE
jgi:hypothetical protein